MATTELEALNLILTSVTSILEEVENVKVNTQDIEDLLGGGGGGIPKASILIQEYFGNEDLDDNGSIFGYDFYVDKDIHLLNAVYEHSEFPGFDELEKWTWDEYLLSISDTISGDDSTTDPISGDSGGSGGSSTIPDDDNSTPTSGSVSGSVFNFTIGSVAYSFNPTTAHTTIYYHDEYETNHNELTVTSSVSSNTFSLNFANDNLNQYQSDLALNDTFSISIYYTYNDGTGDQNTTTENITISR